MFKRTHYGTVKLVFEKRLKPFVIKCKLGQQNDPYIHMPQNCTVFLSCRKLTPSAILGSKHFDSPKWQTMFLCDIKGKKIVISRHASVCHYILLLKYLHGSNHLNFTTNGVKCFSNTNSTNPRQCVPLWKYFL